MQSLIAFIFSKFMFPVLSIIFIIGFYFSARDMDPMASNYPLGIIAIMVILILWTFIGETVHVLKNKEEEVSKYQGRVMEILKDWKKPIYMMLIFFVYTRVIEFIGFYVSTALFLTGLFFLLGKFYLKYLLNVSVIIIISYVLFTVWLKVPLPSGLLL